MTDKSAAAVRAFVEKWAPEAFLPEGDERLRQKMLADLTALISEKQAEYFEFVKWIGFYSTTLYYRDVDEKWLRTRFDIDGIPTEDYDEYTTEELFEYWKTNEQ